MKPSQKRFIQVEIEAITKMGAVAMSARTSPESVTHGVVHLWAHCYTTNETVIDEDLIVTFFGTEAVIRPLVALKFLERVEGGFRVRGAGRYKSDARSEAGAAGGRATQAKRKAEQLQDLPKQNQANGKQTEANVKQTPSNEQLASSKGEAKPKFGQFASPELKQKQAEKRDKSISPTERDTHTHESPVGGPPQHAPGRGRAVAPPKPEPEPEPEWVPAPLCASGRHMVMRLDKRCLDCEREVNAPIEAAKKAAAEAERARIAAIPPPPKEHMAEGLTDAEMGPLLDLYVRRLKMRQAGQDWREAMQ